MGPCVWHPCTVAESVRSCFRSRYSQLPTLTTRYRRERVGKGYTPATSCCSNPWAMRHLTTVCRRPAPIMQVPLATVKSHGRPCIRKTPPATTGNRLRLAPSAIYSRSGARRPPGAQPSPSKLANCPEETSARACGPLDTTLTPFRHIIHCT